MRVPLLGTSQRNGGHLEWCSPVGVRAWGAVRGGPCRLGYRPERPFLLLMFVSLSVARLALLCAGPGKSPASGAAQWLGNVVHLHSSHFDGTGGVGMVGSESGLTLIALSFFYILSYINNFNRGLIKEISSELYDSVFSDFWYGVVPGLIIGLVMLGLFCALNKLWLWS